MLQTRTCRHHSRVKNAPKVRSLCLSGPPHCPPIKAAAGPFSPRDLTEPSRFHNWAIGRCRHDFRCRSARPRARQRWPRPVLASALTSIWKGTMARSSSVTPARWAFEGIVSKRKELRCRSGRSSDWLKMKNPACAAAAARATRGLAREAGDRRASFFRSVWPVEPRWDRARRLFGCLRPLTHAACSSL